MPHNNVPLLELPLRSNHGRRRYHPLSCTVVLLPKMGSTYSFISEDLKILWWLRLCTVYTIRDLCTDFWRGNWIPDMNTQWCMCNRQPPNLNILQLFGSYFAKFNSHQNFWLYSIYIYACKFVLVSTNLVKIYSCILFVLLTWLNCNWNAVRSTIIRHLQCCSIIHTIQQGECHNSLSWAKHHGTLLQYTAIRGWHIQLVGQCGYMLYIRNSNQNWNVWAAFPIIYKILQHILRDHGYIYRNKNMLM